MKERDSMDTIGKVGLRAAGKISRIITHHFVNGDLTLHSAAKNLENAAVISISLMMNGTITTQDHIATRAGLDMVMTNMRQGLVNITTILRLLTVSTISAIHQAFRLIMITGISAGRKMLAWKQMVK